MSGLRGFGMTFTFGNAGGPPRHWYAGKDGVRRWSHNDEPIYPESDFIAAMSAGIPPLGTPDPLSADEAEHGVCALPELTEQQLADGHVTEERR